MCVQSHADNPEVLSALSIERAEADCSSDAGSDVGAEAPGPLLVQVSGAADPMFNKRYRRKRAIIWPFLICSMAQNESAHKSQIPSLFYKMGAIAR